MKIVTTVSTRLDSEERAISDIICNMIAKEYQFEIITSDGFALIAFHKGDWQIEVNNEDHVFVSDGMFVQNALDRPLTLAEGFLTSLLEKHDTTSTEFDARKQPAEAIFKYLDFRLDFKKQSEITIQVEQPGRNGFIKDGKLTLGRKDR